MKQPKLSDLSFDIHGTKQMRSLMAKVKKIKITLNLDSDILNKLRMFAKKSGIPYQVLINRLLRSSMELQETSETRLEKIEKELLMLKRKLSA